MGFGFETAIAPRPACWFAAVIPVREKCGLGGIRTRDLFVANETRYCCATSPCSNNLAGKGFKPSDLSTPDQIESGLLSHLPNYRYRDHRAVESLVPNIQSVEPCQEEQQA